MLLPKKFYSFDLPRFQQPPVDQPSVCVHVAYDTREPAVIVKLGQAVTDKQRAAFRKRLVLWTDQHDAKDEITSSSVMVARNDVDLERGTDIYLASHKLKQTMVQSYDDMLNVVTEYFYPSKPSTKKRKKRYANGSDRTLGT